jgi:hypothetical protein
MMEGRRSRPSCASTSGFDSWGQSFGYDRYGNLTTVNVTQCSAPTLSLSVNSKNQVTNFGFSYDAAGDLTSSGTGTSCSGARSLPRMAGSADSYLGTNRR